MKFINRLCTITTLLLIPSLAVSKENKKYDVIGIGNSMVDIVTKVSDEELLALLPAGGKKGGDIHVDEPTLNLLMAKLTNKKVIPGGSSANVMVDIASLGGKTAFNTVILNDQLGKVFKQSMTKAKVTMLSPVAKSGPGTATCLTFITPDGERSFVVYVGIAADMSEPYINYTSLKDAKVLYTEGSVWDHNGKRAQAVIKAIKQAKATDVKIAFNLHNEFYISQYREEFKKILPLVDIVMSNENEAKELFGTSDLNYVINEYRKYVDVAIITQAANGALIVTKDDVMHIPALAKREDIIDTNGAGDAFAAGFLYGYTHGESLQKSGEIGAQAAAEIIKQEGARPQTSLAKVLS
jgi:sugar/nucleoside kinase (ribokinase family)